MLYACISLGVLLIPLVVIIYSLMVVSSDCSKAEESQMINDINLELHM